MGAESGVVFAGEHGIAQRLDVRLDRFGVRAAETWIAGAANFVAVNFVAGEELVEEACGRAVHGIGNETEICFSQAIPIDQLFEGVQVRRARVESVQQIFAGKEWWRVAVVSWF